MLEQAKRDAEQTKKQAKRDAEQTKQRDIELKELTKLVAAVRVSQGRSGAGSATLTERWSTSQAANSAFRDLDAFFQPLGFSSSCSVPLPKPLTLAFQHDQEKKWFDITSSYEVKVTQPTFMNAIAVAAGVKDAMWLATEKVPERKEVKMQNGVLKMVSGQR